MVILVLEHHSDFAREEAGCLEALTSSICLLNVQMMNGGQQVYSEVDGISALLGYKTANAGCCKVLLLHVNVAHVVLHGSTLCPLSLCTAVHRCLLSCHSSLIHRLEKHCEPLAAKYGTRLG